MRKELYNCLQERWLSDYANDKLPGINYEELMNVINFTNYDIVYTLMEEEQIVKRLIIYPFKCYKIKRITPNQYATISLYDKPSIWIKINRKSITNKLTIIASTENPYTYAPGTLGWIEKKYIEYLIPKSNLLFFD
jgi:hypothetical protein